MTEGFVLAMGIANIILFALMWGYSRSLNKLLESINEYRRAIDESQEDEDAD